MWSLSYVSVFLSGRESDPLDRTLINGRLALDQQETTEIFKSRQILGSSAVL